MKEYMGSQDCGTVLLRERCHCLSGAGYSLEFDQSSLLCVFFPASLCVVALRSCREHEGREEKKPTLDTGQWTGEHLTVPA